MALQIGLSRLGATIFAGALAACSAGSINPAANGTQPSGPLHKHTSSSLITHVVVVIQENRSFDNLFATFPGADGTTFGCMKGKSPLGGRWGAGARATSSGCPSGDTYVPLKETKLSVFCDPGHGYNGFVKSYDKGAMDGFALSGNKCGGNHTEPYEYVNPSQIKPYYALAQQYVLGDHMFQTQGSGSFTAHQDLIAGATLLNASDNEVLVDYPTQSPWGCDAPPGTKTDILINLKEKHNKGPFPCLSYATMRDLLDAKSVSWKYYSPPVQGNTGAIWNAFDAIKVVRDGSEWGVNVTDSEKQIFTDISYGQLPAVSWVVPDHANSDHPGGVGGDTGPSWVASIVNAIGNSAYWPNTAVIVLWDDWGGFYDHVPPPFFDEWGGLGFRVPMLVVSAYAPPAGTGYSYVSHTQYEFGSVLKFIEQTFNLGSLGTTDQRATSISDCFDFTQSPRQFHKIPSKYSEAYFLHQRPSNEPVDTE